MRRIIAFLLLSMLLIGCSTDKTFHWSTFNSDVILQSDGNLLVTETIGLKFDSGSFTFAYRDINDDLLTSISNVSVREQDQAYQQVKDDESKTPLTFAVFEHDGATRIRWVYPESSNSERVFTLRYTVVGAVRQYNNGSQVWWAFVPAKREAQIDSSTNSFTGPEGTKLNGTVMQGDSKVIPNGANMPTLNAMNPVPSQWQANRGTATLKNIPADTEVSVVASVPAGVINSAKPVWQAGYDRQIAYNLNTRPTVNRILSALAAGLLVILGLVWWFWIKRLKEPEPMGAVPHEILNPPSKLTPAEAGRLLRQPDGFLFLGTLFDLAQRGHLRIYQNPAQKWHSASFQLERITSDDSLQSFERELLNSVFQDQPTYTMKPRDGRLVKLATQFGKQVHERLVNTGLLDQTKQAEINKGAIIGSILLAVGVIAIIPAGIFAERISVWLPVIAGVIAFVGLIWLLSSIARQAVTVTGATERAHWQAFKKAISNLKQPHQQFDYLLPYAAAFNEAKSLTKIYSTDNSTMLPLWYIPTMLNKRNSVTTNDNNPALLLQDFSESFLSMLDLSSSSAGGAGGGGGASGGGGAGAG